jgi:hypothetical protein
MKVWAREKTAQQNEDEDKVLGFEKILVLVVGFFVLG